MESPNRPPADILSAKGCTLDNRDHHFHQPKTTSQHKSLENIFQSSHLHSKIIQKSVWRYGHGGNHGSHGGMKTERYWRKSPATDATLSVMHSNCILWLGCAVCNKNGTADLLASFLASNCCKLKLCSHHTQAKERTVHGMTRIHRSCDVMGNSPSTVTRCQ